MMWLLSSRACAALGLSSCKRQPRVVIALLQLSSRLSSLPTNSAACGLRYTSLKWVDIPAIPPCEMGCHRDRGKACDWPRVQVEGNGVTMRGAPTKRSTRAAPCGAGAIRRVMGEADQKLPRRSAPVVPRNRVEVCIYPCGEVASRFLSHPLSTSFAQAFGGNLAPLWMWLHC